MKLFGRKKQVNKPSGRDDTSDASQVVFDADYREELKTLGREHFKKILEKNSRGLSNDLDEILEQLTATLKRHMAGQLDVAIVRVNRDLSTQLNSKMSEYQNILKDSQDQASQSLSKNAEMIQERYQQMSSNLQQIVASQEVMMASIFQDSRNKVAEFQSVQTTILDDLKSDAQASRQQAEELNLEMKREASERSDKLNEVYNLNIEQAKLLKDEQTSMIESLKSNVEALHQQHQDLQKLLDESIANQRKMVVDVVNQNTARIIEHYLIEALGEQSDIVAQLPSILKKMDENKQSMQKDIEL